MLARPFEVRKVETEAELSAVGAFRYRCYLHDKLISPRSDETFLDEYDFTSNALVFTISSYDRIVGTIRLHILDQANHEFATISAFSNVLMPKIAAGRTLIDGARFAVEPSLGSMRLPVARRTLRLYAKFAKEHRVNYSVASVQQDRVKFYQRLWGFKQIAEPRPYGGLREKLVLLGVDLRPSKSEDTGD